MSLALPSLPSVPSLPDLLNGSVSVWVLLVGGAIIFGLAYLVRVAAAEAATRWGWVGFFAVLVALGAFLLALGVGGGAGWLLVVVGGVMMVAAASAE